MHLKSIVAVAALSLSGLAMAIPASYTLDPSHTYPSFEADHFGGMSNWRGKINQSSGKVMIDREAKNGSVEVTMQMATIDFGHAKMNDHARGEQIFDTVKYPTAVYKGNFSKFNGENPTEVTGTLTLHGVTKPVTLAINQFACKIHPMSKKEFCGADASATINRADFGVDYGIKFGFKPEVKLQIQVEGTKD